jgi:hypothetical protein
MHHPGTANIEKGRSSLMKRAIIVLDFMSGPGWHNYTDMCSVLRISRKVAYGWKNAIAAVFELDSKHIHGKEFVFKCALDRPLISADKPNDRVVAIVRAAKLLRIIRQNGWHSYEDLGNILGVGRKQTFRWVAAIEECGIPLEFEMRPGKTGGSSGATQWFRRIVW